LIRSERALTLARMSDPKDQHRHLALWIAVGGTAAAVVALWALILPTQIRRVRLEGERDRSRWTVLGEDGQSVQKSFSDIMAEQRARLDEIEAKMRETVAAPDAAQAQVQDLTAKIEAAGAKTTDAATAEPKN
jgi:hypothetical protein